MLCAPGSGINAVDATCSKVLTVERRRLAEPRSAAGRELRAVGDIEFVYFLVDLVGRKAG